MPLFYATPNLDHIPYDSISASFTMLPNPAVRVEEYVVCSMYTYLLYQCEVCDQLQLGGTWLASSPLHACFSGASRTRPRGASIYAIAQD